MIPHGKKCLTASRCYGTFYSGSQRCSRVGARRDREAGGRSETGAFSLPGNPRHCLCDSARPLPVRGRRGASGPAGGRGAGLRTTCRARVALPREQNGHRHRADAPKRSAPGLPRTVDQPESPYWISSTEHNWFVNYLIATFCSGSPSCGQVGGDRLCGCPFRLGVRDWGQPGRPSLGQIGGATGPAIPATKGA